MEAGGVAARLGEIQRIGAESGDGALALVAAVIAQAVHDAEHGEPGTASDPRRAQDWLEHIGREWLEALQAAAARAGGARARRVA